MTTDGANTMASDGGATSMLCGRRSGSLTRRWRSEAGQPTGPSGRLAQVRCGSHFRLAGSSARKESHDELQLRVLQHPRILYPPLQLRGRAHKADRPDQGLRLLLGEAWGGADRLQVGE